MVELVRGFVHLLAQEMERGQDLGARFVGVELDIVAHGVGREEAIHAARGEQFPATMSFSSSCASSKSFRASGFSRMAG